MKTLASAALAAVNFLHALLFGGAMDDTAWDVRVKQDGFFHWGSKKDTLIFSGGKLLVAGAVSQGYRPTLYEARGEEAGTAFEAVMNRSGEDAVEWSGRVIGDRIAGVVIVRARDGRVVRYSFHGERKAG